MINRIKDTVEGMKDLVPAGTLSRSISKSSKRWLDIILGVSNKKRGLDWTGPLVQFKSTQNGMDGERFGRQSRLPLIYHVCKFLQDVHCERLALIFRYKL